MKNYLFVVSKISFNDINLEKNFSVWNAYGQSKLANVLFTRELSKRLENTNIHVYALHPGCIRTELTRHTHRTGILHDFIAKVLLRDAKLGAQTTLHCAISSDAESESGLYYELVSKISLKLLLHMNIFLF